ncbi:MAG TPA: hypothetical protein VMG12_13915 [Polyangiaceae bacterium]|nr:hypothetical protein [Polyangiaceae bacterium]
MLGAPCRRLSSTAAVLLGLACSRDAGTDAALAPPPPPVPLPLRGPSRIAIPGGTFTSGTEPGRFEREPELEPRLARTALGPFEIDAEPFPGGATAPLLGLDRDAAIQRCADRGGRLCSELEWERACKGPEQQPFPSGTELEPACTQGTGCASGFGVWGLSSGREWTASDTTRRGELAAVLRGAAASAPTALHRCAHREPGPATATPGVAFRCCYGPPNAARVVLPRLAVAFSESELPPAELGAALAKAAETRAIASDVSYFDGKAARDTVFARGEHDREGLTFTSAPLAWNPAPGVELLVVTGRSGASTSFVVAFDLLGDGSRRLASSFIMLDEPGPVVLAYRPSQRAKLQFSTCWGCPGETGRVLYRDPDQTLITQP